MSSVSIAAADDSALRERLFKLASREARFGIPEDMGDDNQRREG